MSDAIYFQLATPQGGTTYGSASEPSLVPEGATILAGDVYDQRLAAAQQSAATQIAAQHAMAAAQAADDYAALIAAGIPDATAARLTGHTPT